MFLTYLMLAVALCLSAIAAFYSIVGLAAIFAAAVVPIVVMGSILEIAKLTVTVWLHEYWHQCKRAMKIYLVPAVGVLMLITSMGIFGFLSKAHLDQAVPAGDISAQVAVYDEKIKTQRDNIEAARAALRQLDAAVDQTMSRSNDEKGAERAVQIRRQQATERNRLQQDISRSQAEIVKLNEQRAPIAAQARKVEAEVGPIKYIAALIYGDNPDANLLEKAVRWVIIILVLVFDPLAIFMLLAATESYKWEKYAKSSAPEASEDKSPTHQVNDAIDNARAWGESLWQKIKRKPKNESNNGNDDTKTSDDNASVPDGGSHQLVGENVTEPATDTGTGLEENLAVVVDSDDEPGDSAVLKQAKALWKQDNPDKTLKEQRKLLANHAIDRLPWEDYVNDPRIVHDVGYGDAFPDEPFKGDLWVLTDSLPTRLYKYNGEKWIEVDKNQTDQYVYNTAYIDHLIQSISQGQYDPELLTDSEREQIESRLRKEV